MIKQSRKIMILLIGFSALAMYASAQSERKWEDIGTKDIYKKQILKKDGITLVFINKDSLFNQNTGQNIINAFWKVYPEEAMRFDAKGIKKTVTIVITEEYKGVAATLSDIIKINPAYMEAHPEDIDVITHELMHVVQAYGNNEAPWWLTEGIADYARYKYGVNNEKAGWALTEYKPGQHYDNGYRITARFLVWIEKNIRTDVVDQLDHALRTSRYTPALWSELTGKTVEDLWKDYSLNPVI
jgi:hypothetical protein